MKNSLLFLVLCGIWYGSYTYFPHYFEGFDNALIDIFGYASAWNLQLFGFEFVFETEKNLLFFAGKAQLHIGEPCNARDLFAFHLFFFAAFHAFWRSPKFLIAGLALIFGLNTLRISVLALNALYFEYAFDFNHHVLFPILVYSALFLLWEKSLGKSSLGGWQYLGIIAFLSLNLLVGESRFLLSDYLEKRFAIWGIPNFFGAMDTFLITIFYTLSAWAVLVLYFWENKTFWKHYALILGFGFVLMTFSTLIYKVFGGDFLKILSENLIFLYFSPYALLILFFGGYLAKP